MPVYNYEARTKEGETQAGRVDAPTKRVASDILQRHGLVVVALEEAKEVPLYARSVKFFERVGIRDIVIFSRQITTLFEAEVPLVASLETVAAQTENRRFKEIIFEISADVEAGTAFSEALGRHADVFSDFYIQMVKAGEASGRMDQTLNYLADHMEREYQVISRVRGALIYPAFVIVGFSVAFSVLMIFVIPHLTSILEQSGQALPVLTKLIIGVSKFLRSSWYILLLGLVGGGAATLRYVKTPTGKKMWDRIQLKFPVFGGILTKMYLFRFAESLSTLIEGGLPVTRALAIARDVTGNTLYKGIINEALEDVKRGGTIGGSLALSDAIPPLVTQMVVVGEQAGKLVQVLQNVARFYRKDVDNAIDNITSLIEPILILVMGVGVGLLVAGVMIPIYNLAGSF
ncbi:MAG: type II secretion system F family protein [Candidatus Spechtbacteria bacterium]|nr:type II secretion system F family protein [Candidatus Spechtbacteria bacterium]